MNRISSDVNHTIILFPQPPHPSYLNLPLNCTQPIENSIIIMFHSQIPRRFLQRTAVQRPTTYRPTTLALPRFLSSTSSLQARKDTQDKDSLNPQSSEYSKSGDDDAASGSGAAFDPNTTSPESAEKSNEQENGGNGALNVSPGNPEVSKPRGDEEGGAQGSPKSGSSSGSGSAPKAGGNKSG
jgi:hypothetical protein